MASKQWGGGEMLNEAVVAKADSMVIVMARMAKAASIR